MRISIYIYIGIPLYTDGRVLYLSFEYARRPDLLIACQLKPHRSLWHACVPRPGRATADRQSLLQRAQEAAEAAAARYQAPRGSTLVCNCIGKPYNEEEPSPMPQECDRNPERWVVPQDATKVRLAFEWDIIEDGEVLATESASRDVRLDDAEKQGVPLPKGWTLEAAPPSDSNTEAKGALCASSSCLLLTPRPPPHLRLS